MRAYLAPVGLHYTGPRRFGAGAGLSPNNTGEETSPQHCPEDSTHWTGNDLDRTSMFDEYRATPCGRHRILSYHACTAWLWHEDRSRPFWVRFNIAAKLSAIYDVILGKEPNKCQ